MKLDRKSMLLYAITDRTWLKGETLSSQVEDTIKGGATFIQLREKNLSFNDFVKQAEEIKSVTDKYNIPFVINDNMDVALAVNSDGVHVGQDDMNAKDVRKLIGKDKIIGVSVQTVEQAILAEQNGADYLGVGAVFPTSTKSDANCISLEQLKEISMAVSTPIVAIGGINEENIEELKGTNVDGICVISAIFSKINVFEATKKLRKLSEGIVDYEV
ncbi:MAG: thiamine phosphate synthase [Clostridiaceae bacterium]|uniref:thiamine phosphate synthase n=1 Tax=Anaerosalibacter bizertensis TaxID=932217 RepID=UPI001D011AEA|nr:thiamine phosphate synthase [Anaerosalibacter bizertensis]MBW4829446.1 thiamine phosphate synthase [Clostridiaceae bacterium]MBW4859450.1 thiamine phosphate synthase [Clostridiaceae bacterium]MBW4867295.1 thiamine phosphate synthase [Clostridiaceae bacterium]MCB5558565.1 thiamine phosphate synthase [Anaerosalibacter bizertensis]MCG4584249.1 thiamine phosphate synthase [Anaerosalibacter bizertensis]